MISYLNYDNSYMNLEQDRHTIPAVEKCIQALLKLGESDKGIHQKDLAALLHLTPSTTYRILRTLSKYGWVRKDREGLFDLSSGMMPLLLKFQRREPHWVNARNALRILATATGLSAKLSIRRGDQQVTIARIDGSAPFSVSSKNGSTFPLAEGSVGAALLCRTPDEECLQLLTRTDDEIPEKSDPDLLLSSIAFCRLNGYSLNVDHNRWNIGALSAPFFGSSGKVDGALTCLGFRHEFTETRLPQLVHALLRATKELQTIYPGNAAP